MKPVQTLPESYIEKGTLDLSKDQRALIFLNIVGMVLLVASGWIFIQAAVWLRPGEAPSAINLPLSTIPEGLITIIAILVITMIMLLVHEGIHGLFFWLFTHSRPLFGIGPGYAYAAAPGWYLPARKYLVVATAPLVLITLGGVVLLKFIPTVLLTSLIALMAFNFSGAVGDMAVAFWLLRQPESCLAQDRGDSVTLYVKA